MLAALLSGHDLIAFSIAAFVVLVSMFRVGRRLEVQVGQVRAKVDDAKSTIEDVGYAVNHRANDEPSLYDAVKACRAEICGLQGRLDGVASRIDRHIAYHEGFDQGRAP